MAKFGVGIASVQKKDLYKLYKREIKKNKNPLQLLQQIAEYAEIYNKIVNVESSEKFYQQLASYQTEGNRGNEI
jgi:hypothetical protein